MQPEIVALSLFHKLKLMIVAVAAAALLFLGSPGVSSSLPWLVLRQELPPWFLERQNITRRYPGQS